MTTIDERLARLEEGHVNLVREVEKKLSKHQFNNLSNVVQNLKDIFLQRLDKYETALVDNIKSTTENTRTIASLQTSIDAAKHFLPILIKTIKFFGTIIVFLTGFIGSKLMGWW